VITTLPPSPVYLPTTYLPTYIPTSVVHTVPNHSSIVVVPSIYVPRNAPSSVVIPVPTSKITTPTPPPTTVVERCAQIVKSYSFPIPPTTVPRTPTTPTVPAHCAQYFLDD